MADRLRLLIVSGFGSGLLPGAPGTWASGLAVGLWLLVGWEVGWGAWPLDVLTVAGVVLASAACVLLGPWAVRRVGRDDPGFVVVDELAGQWVALLVLPTRLMFVSEPWAAPAVGGLAFVLFRLFDILKPQPCRQLEDQPGGWGILADDLMAGFYANLLAQAILRGGELLYFAGWVYTPVG